MGRAPALSAVSWRKAFNQKLGRLKNPRAAIQALRASLGEREPALLFDELHSHAMFLGAIAPNRAPRRLVEMRSTRRLPSQGLAADIRWSGEVIARFAVAAVDLLACERKFEDAYLKGDFSACLESLEGLEERQGLSNWLISRRITVSRLIGPTSLADYINPLIAGSREGTIDNWLLYMIGYRADPNITPGAYVRLIDHALGTPALSATLREYLRYHALNVPPRTLAECAAVIATSENAPLVDRYIALLDVLQCIACLPWDVTERSAAAASAKRLAQTIPDERLRILDEVLDPLLNRELVQRVRPAAADAYTAGDYTTTIDLLTTELAEEPGRTGLYSLAARASLRTGMTPELPPGVRDYVANMASVHVFASDDDTAAATLLREALTGVHRGLARSIRSLFASRTEDPSDRNYDAAVEALNGVQLTPLQLRNLPVNDAVHLVGAAADAYPESLSLELQRAVLNFGRSELPPGLSERLPPDRATLYAARALFRLERYDEAAILLQAFEDAAAPAVANDARRELFNARFAAGRLEDSLRIVARAHRRNEKLHRLFDLKTLLDTVEISDERPPFDQISLSICYHILNRFSGDARLGAQADAAEEFALSRGADLPSKVDPNSVGQDIDLLPLYLDQVCSAAILDKFMAIETVNQVEVERLEICRILSERDQPNRQRYLDEIREITRRRVVRERFEQVERTKIYVDTDGVKRQAEKTLRDTYARFLVALAEDTEGSERLEMMRRVQSILSDINADGVKIHFADLPANERDIMFDRLVRDFMRMLVSSKEYGLEAYLSTRVRHGTMGNQLRSALEIHSLITQRDGGLYQPDRFWPAALELTFDARGAWLSDRLAAFSQAVDERIEDLVRRRVQVRSEATPDGLFVFQNFNFDTLRLQSEITSDTSFETFLDKVVEQFWKVLDHSLEMVRRYINTDFLRSMHNLTDQLQRDLVSELVGVNSSLLRDAIAAARTQIGVTVANVASWFTLARDMERPDYEFGVAVEVASDSIRVCHPSIDAALTRTDEVSFECRGRSLESLVYVLFTALDNAVEHCGLVDEAPTLTLSTVLEDGWLELKLINSCADVADVASANQRLAELKARLENAADIQALASKEGGSGYAKIIRILRHDLLARHTLDFGYLDPNAYAVTIGVEARAIVK
jgi:tetratricopeptide (TPR) repeat protein